MIRNLLLSGGIYHPFTETSHAIRAHLQTKGIRSDLCSIPDGLRRLTNETFDLITVNGLAFSMTQAEKYAPMRAQWAYEIDPAAQEALTDHVSKGRGLLGIHAATICFDTWSGWMDLLGSRWVWGQSMHPMPDHVSVAHGSDTFDLWDELYCGLELHRDTTVHATARLTTGGGPEPVLTQKGHAAYLSLGHDLTSVATPHYRRLLDAAVNLTGVTDAEQ